MNQKEQLDELIRDIQTLKSSIKKNRAVIYDMMIGRQFGLLSLVMGIALTGYALSAHFLSRSFGSWAAIPGSVRLTMTLIIVLLGLTGAIGKFIGMASRAKEIGSISGIKEFIAIYYSTGTVLHNTIAAVVVIIAGGAACVLLGHRWLLVPLITCAMAFPMNDIGSASGLGEYYVFSYWALAAGLSSLLYVESYPFIALAVCAGGSFIVFAVLAFLSLRRKPR